MKTVAFRGLADAVDKISARVGVKARPKRKVLPGRVRCPSGQSSSGPPTDSDSDAPKPSKGKRKASKAKPRKARAPKNRKIGVDYESADDSDFWPDGSPPSSPKRTRSKTPTGSQEDLSNPVTAGDLILPGEVWGRIFAFSTGGSVADILRLAKVSRRFRNVALSSRLLWRRVDLESGRLKRDSLEPLFTFVRDRLPPNATHVALPGWPKLRVEGLGELLRNTKCLKSLNLSGCSRVCNGGSVFSELLPAHAPGIETLDLSFVNSASGNSEAGFTAHLEKYLAAVLPQLRSLCLNGNLLSLSAISGGRGIFKPEAPGTQLHSLDISGVQLTSLSGARIPVHDFADATPNLVTLRAVHCPVIFTWDPMAQQLPHTSVNQTRWLLLKSLDCGLLDKGPKMGGPLPMAHLDLIRFAACCPGLEELGVDRNEGAIAELHGVHADNLRRLSAARTVPLGNPMAASMAASVLTAIQGQLEELDLSWTKNPTLFAFAFMVGIRSSNDISNDVLSKEPNPRLKRLTLSGASLPETDLRRIVGSCVGLEALDLESVRSVPRGLPRRCSSAKEVDEFRRRLKKIPGENL